MVITLIYLSGIHEVDRLFGPRLRNDVSHGGFDGSGHTGRPPFEG
jgi:hypothetical protein